MKTLAPERMRWRFPILCDVKIGTKEDLEHAPDNTEYVEYVRADLYDDLLRRLRELKKEMESCTVLPSDDPGDVYFGLLEMFFKHFPELEDK